MRPVTFTVVHESLCYTKNLFLFKVLEEYCLFFPPVEAFIGNNSFSPINQLYSNIVNRLQFISNENKPGHP